MPVLVCSYPILNSCHYLYNEIILEVVAEQLSNWLPYQNNCNFWKPDRVTKKGGKQYNPMHSNMEKGGHWICRSFDYNQESFKYNLSGSLLSGTVCG